LPQKGLARCRRRDCGLHPGDAAEACTSERAVVVGGCYPIEGTCPLSDNTRGGTGRAGRGGKGRGAVGRDRRGDPAGAPGAGTGRGHRGGGTGRGHRAEAPGGGTGLGNRAGAPGRGHRARAPGGAQGRVGRVRLARASARSPVLSDPGGTVDLWTSAGSAVTAWSMQTSSWKPAWPGTRPESGCRNPGKRPQQARPRASRPW